MKQSLPTYVTNPWAALAPAAEEKQEDWVMLDEDDVAQDGPMKGPLTGPLAEFVVPKKAARRQERWEVLGYPL